jgi:hypothetical protein
MGLIRGMARTAAVAGTATAVSNRVSRRQQRRWAAHDQPDQGTDYAQADQAPAPVEDDLTAKLGRLTDLKNSGQLTNEEFAVAKAKLLGI